MSKEVDEYFKKHAKTPRKQASFQEYLYELMDLHGYEKNSDLYNKANISRQLFSSIISGKSEPSLNVCIKLALVLHLSNEECKYLLKKAGFTLASSSKYNLIIRYCLDNKIYDIQKLNDILEEYGYTEFIE